MRNLLVGLFVLVLAGAASGDVILGEEGGVVRGEAHYGGASDQVDRPLVHNQPSTWSGNLSADRNAGSANHVNATNTYRFTRSEGLTLSGSHRRPGYTGGFTVARSFGELTVRAAGDTPYHITGQSVAADADPRGGMRLFARLTDLSTGLVLFEQDTVTRDRDRLNVGDPGARGATDGLLLDGHWYRFLYAIELDNGFPTPDAGGALGTFDLAFTVPEPGCFSLVAVGLLGLLRRR
jgi:hypothetical protein